MNTVPAAGKSPHVPDQAYGYSLQATRFLARLLTSREDAIVSLEVFEDVGVEDQNGVRFAEQVKSTHSGNPISDRSVEFWKTLANWVAAVQSGELDASKTTFGIYVSVTRSGDIAESFSRAKTIVEAQQALHDAKRKLWGSTPEHEHRTTVAKELVPYIETVFLADEKITLPIIASFDLIFGSGSPIEDVRELFAKLLIPPELCDDALMFAHGWVKEKIDRLIELRQPASLSVSEFRTALIAFVRKHDNRKILCSVARKPAKETVENELHLRTYIDQLALIQSGDEEKLQAVSDYLAASADRTQWSVEGSVDTTSFDELEKDLIRTWQNLKRKTELDHSGIDEIRRGRYLYAVCGLYKTTLEGLELPSHFIPGSLHALADELAIGWHPNYRDLLTAPKKA